MVIAMKNLNNIKHNMRNIGYLYNHFIYENHTDCFSVEYLDDIPAKKLKKKLDSYFISMDWDISSTWKQLNLVQKDFVLRSKGCFQKISDITIDEKDKLISLKYPFLLSKQEACKSYQLLKHGKIEDFMSQYQKITEEALHWETDRLMLLLHHLESMLDIKVE
jgi:hypothetical protein